MEFILRTVSRTSSYAGGTDDLSGIELVRETVLIAGSNHSLAMAQWAQFERAPKNSGGGPGDATTDHLYQTSRSCLGQHSTICEMHSFYVVKHYSVNGHIQNLKF